MHSISKFLIHKYSRFARLRIQRNYESLEGGKEHARRAVRTRPCIWWLLLSRWRKVSSQLLQQNFLRKTNWNWKCRSIDPSTCASINGPCFSVKRELTTRNLRTSHGWNSTAQTATQIWLRIHGTPSVFRIHLHFPYRERKLKGVQFWVKYEIEGSMQTFARWSYTVYEVSFRNKPVEKFEFSDFNLSFAVTNSLMTHGIDESLILLLKMTFEDRRFRNIADDDFIDSNSCDVQSEKFSVLRMWDTIEVPGLAFIKENVYLLYWRLYFIIAEV